MSRILLIEPDVVLNNTYAAALSNAGHDMDVCLGAQAGIFAIEANRPDLIILELELAGHGGIEFLHELRSYSEWQKIPILLHTFLTPQRLASRLERLQAMGVNLFLYKPTTSLRQLVQAVGSMLYSV